MIIFLVCLGDIIVNLEFNQIRLLAGSPRDFHIGFRILAHFNPPCNETLSFS